MKTYLILANASFRRRRLFKKEQDGGWWMLNGPFDAELKDNEMAMVPIVGFGSRVPIVNPFRWEDEVKRDWNGHLENYYGKAGQ